MLIEEPRRELFECGHLLLLLLGRAAEDQVTFPVLCPPLRGRLRVRRRLHTFPILRAVREAEADIRLPPPFPVPSECHAHRLPSDDGVRLWSRNCNSSPVRIST